MFAYVDQEQYMDRRRLIGITWDEVPSLAWNLMDHSGLLPFPRYRKKTEKNLRDFVEGYLKGDKRPA